MPDTLTRRVIEVHRLAAELRLYDRGALVAVQPARARALPSRSQTSRERSARCSPEIPTGMRSLKVSRLRAGTAWWWPRLR